jgi:RES domain-containing protein
LRWSGTAWRAHHPRWSWAPLSGEGAALKGGRFNPVGVPALYLALSLEGMWVEMGHGFARRLDPLTVCAYEVDVDGITDLRGEVVRAAAGVALAEMACPWALDRAEGRRPESSCPPSRTARGPTWPTLCFGTGGRNRHAR